MSLNELCRWYNLGRYAFKTKSPSVLPTFQEVQREKITASSCTTSIDLEKIFSCESRAILAYLDLHFKSPNSRFASVSCSLFISHFALSDLKDIVLSLLWNLRYIQVGETSVIHFFLDP